MCRSKFTLILAILLAVFLVGAPPVAGQRIADQTPLPWHIETIAEIERCFDNQIDLENGSDGSIQVIYNDITKAGPVYARRAEGGWTTEVVAPGTIGKDPSLALDSNNSPHVSYRDGLRNQLMYTFWNVSGWESATVGNNLVGFSSAIALDAQDRAHISFLGVGQQPSYAHWNGVEWETRTIEGTFTSGDTSIAVDSVGTPHVIYVRYNEADMGTDLRYAVYTNTHWISETIDGPGVSGISIGPQFALALGPGGVPHVSYSEYVGIQNMGGTADDLVYAVKQNGAWSSARPDPRLLVGGYSSIGVDSQNRPHIAYYQTDLQIPPQPSVWYAYWDGTSWALSLVDQPVILDGNISLAVDQDDLPHMVYCDEQAKAVKYVRQIKSMQFLPMLRRPPASAR